MKAARGMALGLAVALTAAACGVAGGSDSTRSGTGTASATFTHPAPKMTYPRTAMPSYSYPPGADPALEAQLPAEVDGVRLFRWSIPGAASGGGGDMCFFFCPGEPYYFALALNLKGLDGTTAAIGVPEDQPTFPVQMIAFRVPSVSAGDLIPAWVTAEYRSGAEPVGGNIPTPSSSPLATPTSPPLPTLAASIGGKNVTILFDRYKGVGGSFQYLYARDDVLFIVQANSISFNEIDDPNNPPEAYVDSIAALP